MAPRRISRSDERTSEGSTEQVVAHVRDLIERRALRPGDRLPAERDLATQIGVSRPTVRIGLRALAAMGVVRSRHGSGTYIPDGTADARQRAAEFSGRAARLHARGDVRGAADSRSRRRRPGRRSRDARSVGDAGRRGREPVRVDAGRRSASWSTTSIFIASVAAASGNPIVASLVEMVSALYYERRRQTAERASDRDLRDAAEMHRRIYQAVRSRDAEAARQAMHEHLVQASRHQAQEPADVPAPRRRRPVPRSIRRTAWPGSTPGAGTASTLMATSAFDLDGTRGGRRRRDERHRPHARARPGGRRRRRRGDRPARRSRGVGRRRDRGQGPPVAAGRRATSPTPASLERVRDACLKDVRRRRHRRRGGRHDQTGADAARWPTRTGTPSSRRISTGTFRTCRVVRGADGRARGRGRIITIASLSSFVGLFEVAAYTASKSGGRGTHACARGRVGAARRHGQRDRARACSAPISTARCSTRRAARSS